MGSFHRAPSSICCIALGLNFTPQVKRSHPFLFAEWEGILGSYSLVFAAQYY